MTDCRFEQVKASSLTQHDSTKATVNESKIYSIIENGVSVIIPY